MACKVTYDGKVFSKEQFHQMIELGAIPEARIIKESTTELTASQFKKDDDIFISTPKEGKFNRTEFEEQVVSNLSHVGRYIYNDILKKSLPENFGVIIESEYTGKRDKNNRKVVGEWNGINNNAYVYKQEEYEDDREQTLLHEIFHAAFDNFIYAYFKNKSSLTDEQIEALEESEVMFDYYQNNRKDDMPDFMEENSGNKMKAMQEFYNESLTNPGFLKQLNTMDYQKENSDPTIIKMLKNIRDFILKLFGQQGNTLGSATLSKIMFLTNTRRPEMEFQDVLDATSYKRKKTKDDDDDDSKFIKEEFYKEQEESITKLQNHIDRMNYEVALDEQGRQLPYYQNKENNNRLRRVTNIINSTFRGFEEEYDWIEKRAERLWDKRGRDVSEKIKVRGTEYLINKEEYIKNANDKLKKDIAKGNIIHLVFQKLMGEGNKETINAQINAIQLETGLEHWNYKFVESVFKNFTDQMYFTAKTKSYAEVPVFSEELDLAGMIDHLIIYDDGTFGINDWKSGTSFDKVFDGVKINFGDVVGQDLKDDPLTAAKLQVMLYAMMFKMQNPDAKFKSLTVHKVNRFKGAKRNSNNAAVDIEAYMEAIGSWMKAEHPEVYKKYADTAVFRASEYYGYANNTVTAAARAGVNISDIRPQWESELLSLVHRHQGISPRVVDRAGMYEQRQSIADLSKKILDLEAGGDMYRQYENSGGIQDLTIVERWMASYENINNPFLNNFKTMYDQRKHQALREINTKMAHFQNLLTPIYNDWIRDTGRSTTKALFKDRLTWVPPTNDKGTGLFDFAWVAREEDGVETEEVMHPVVDKERFDKLNENQKALLEYFHSEIHSYFDPADANAMMNRKVTDNTTNLQILERRYADSEYKFEYKPGMTPRFHKSMKEIINDYGFFSKENLKSLYERYFTYRVEATWDEWMNDEEIIPVKGIPNDHNVESDMYTRNVEVIFDRFMRNMVMKEKMDIVYAVGKGIQTYLRMKQEKDPNNSYKNTIDFLEDKMLMDILNQTRITLFKRKSFNMPDINLRKLTIGSKDEPPEESANKRRESLTQAFSVTKLLQSLKHLTSASIMWLQPVNGTRNGIFVGLVNAKDAVRNSILDSGLEGVDGNEVDFTTKDMAFAYGKVMGMYKDSMVGNIRQNKLYLLAKQLDYLPDNFDWATNENELISGSATIVQESTFYMFHTIPEEAHALMIMAAQLHRMQNKANGKSLWDSYSIPKDKGNGVYEVNWEGGIRGIVRNGAIETELTEIDGLEARKLKRVYQRMHGNYRREERAAMEAYVLGQVLLQFRKYLGSIIFGAFGSKRYDKTLGYYKQVDTKDKKSVMEWHSRLIEGRWITMAQFLMNTLGLSKSLKGKYNWAELSTDQKAQVIDSVATLMLWSIVMAASYAVFGGDDDKDSVKMFMTVVAQNSTQHWNMLDVVRSVRQPPATLEKPFQTGLGLTEMMASLFFISIGDDDSAYTRDGRFKGWARTQKGIPLSNSFYNTRRFFERTDIFGDADGVLAYEWNRTR
jgi:hypothetical protein